MKAKKKKEGPKPITVDDLSTYQRVADTLHNDSVNVDTLVRLMLFALAPTSGDDDE